MGLIVNVGSDSELISRCNGYGLSALRRNDASYCLGLPLWDFKLQAPGEKVRKDEFTDGNAVVSSHLFGRSGDVMRDPHPFSA